MFYRILTNKKVYKVEGSQNKRDWFHVVPFPVILLHNEGNLDYTLQMCRDHIKKLQREDEKYSRPWEVVE